MAYAVDFSDGASDYAAADILKVWSSWTASQPTIGTSDVDGGTIIRPTGLTRIVTSSVARIAGFRTKTLSTASVSGDVLFAYVTGTSTTHVFLTVDNQGRLRLECPSVTLGPSAVNTLVVGTYAVIEIGCLVDNSAGRVEVRVNGTIVPALTSTALGGSATNALDTQSGASATITKVKLDSNTGLGWAQEVDWFWTAWDTAVWGSSNWLGSVSKITLRPKAGTAGNGFYNTGTAWAVGVGGATIPDTMRETTVDGDTSFSFRASPVSGTATDRFGVKVDAMPTLTASVKLMSHRAWVGAAAENSSTHNRFVYDGLGLVTYDSGITVTDGQAAYATGTGSGSTGNHMQDNFLLYPSGAALSKALIDSTQIGVKVLTLSGAIRCSHDNLLVLYVSGSPPVDPPGTFFDSDNACPIGQAFQAGVRRGQGVCA